MAAAVTRLMMINSSKYSFNWQRAQQTTMLVLLMCLATLAQAAVLPEERADLMYHRYEGGGITIDGPSVLVRKNFAGKVSVSGNYYVDSISSASVDVEAILGVGASRYEEERTEYSLGADYLYSKTLMSVGYTNSSENDYEGETTFVAISQDFFGDLTTISLSYARGDDIVRENTGDNGVIDRGKVDRQNYRFGITQIATPSLIFSLNYEAITEEGFLNNPYRQYRFRVADSVSSRGWVFDDERYPNTRTSDAISLTASYYLPYRAALKGEYRHYTDDWDIKGDDFKISYTHPVSDHLILDFHYRVYEQTGAFFYSDLFDFQSQDEQDFRARDKELSDMSSESIGFAISYEFKYGSASFLDKSSITLEYDMLSFSYDNFSNLATTETFVAGEEPLYDLEAEVIKFYFSAWY